MARKFFEQLEEYLKTNKIVVNGKRLMLNTYGDKNFATITTTNNVWVNLRLNKKGDDKLLEIGIIFYDEVARKAYYDRYEQQKERIEKFMGSHLVWQPHCYFDENKKSARMNRYGPEADPNKPKNKYLCEKFTQAIQENPYNFDIVDIKRVVDELIKYYKVKLYIEEGVELK